jgi:hypothetical protein
MRASLEAMVTASLIILGGLLSAYSFTTLLKQESPEYVLLSGLRTGQQFLTLQHASGCAGELKTNLEEERGFVLQIEGPSVFSFARKQIVAHAKIGAYFNPLGQLIEGNLTVESVGVRLKLKATGITPLKINILAELPNRSVSRSLELPTPLTITQRSGFFQIEYPSTTLSNNSLLSTFGQNIRSSAPFEINTVLASDSKCQEPQRNPIALDDTFKKIQDFASPILNLIPQEP